MKSWKKRWEEELDAVIPALDKAIINEPIPVVERKKEEKKKPVTSLVSWIKKLFATPRRVTAFATACAVALVAVGSSLYFGLSKPLTASAEVISVEVNPQAVFSVDKKGKVTAVIASNADADVVLSENRDEEMEGKAVEEAIKIFVDYTAQLGYLDLENNLENPEAVRITSCTKNGKLDEVGDTLEAYFRENGLFVAVVEETVGVKDFCERANLAVKSSIEELKNSVESIPAMLFEREAMEKSLEELQASYGDIVTEEVLTEIFITKGFKKIEERKAALDEIEAKLDEVKEHSDNPGKKDVIPIPKDYWDIIKDNHDLTEELSALVMEVTEKISAYETVYGVVLEKANITTERLKNVTEAASVLMNAVSQTLESVLEDFENIGVDISLYNIPASIEAYTSQVGEYVKESFSALRDKYKEKYETARGTIEEVRYEDFINGLIAEYGSLSEYFNKK